MNSTNLIFVKTLASKLAICGGIVALTLISIGLLGSRAEAAVNENNWAVPGSVIDSVTNGCPPPNVHALNNWLSPFGNPTASFNINIVAGSTAQSYYAQLNFATGWCQSGLDGNNDVPLRLRNRNWEDIVETFNRVIEAPSYSPAVTGGLGIGADIITGSYNDNVVRVYWDDINRYQYPSNAIPIRIDIPANINIPAGETRQVDVSLLLKGGNHFYGGPWVCFGHPDGKPYSVIPDNPENCDSYLAWWTFSITVLPPPDQPATGNFDTANSNCNILTGLANDPDWGGNSTVHIYRDGAIAGVVTTSGGRWSYDISQFRDFNAHTYTAYVLGLDRFGNTNGVNTFMGSFALGPCASSTCQQYTISGFLEIGSEFTLNASVQTSVGSGGGASSYSASLSIPSAAYVTPVSTTGTVAYGSNTPVASWKVRIDNPGNHDGSFTFNVNGAAITCPFTNNYNGSGSCGPGGCSIKVSVKPYFRVYGGNVTAGISDTTCTLGSVTPSSSGRILAFSGGGGNGSGTQLIAQAIGSIDGFSSAQGPAGNSSPDKGLSFSNTAGNPTYGGAFGYGACPDLPTTGAIGSFDGNSPTVLNTGEKRVIYVNGDITIRGNVTYSGTWTKPEDVPSFVLVANGGNIYIDRSVTELHGLYVAKPAAGGTKGNIYTCTNGSVLYSGAGLSTGADQNSLPCSTPLTVYGSFMAKQVKLLRTNGRASAASNGHTWNTSLTPQLAPAEKFIYSPEVWFRSNGAGSTVGGGDTFDSLKPMPPVL